MDKHYSSQISYSIKLLEKCFQIIGYLINNEQE